MPHNTDLIKKAEKLIFTYRDSLSAIDLLKYENFEEAKKLLAFSYFDTTQYYEASEVYKELNFAYQYGYCSLLMGDLKEAKQAFMMAKESSAQQWGLCIVDFISLKVERIPTFLQIRQFLEYDICNLLKAKKLELAENLISADEFLLQINPETYKYIGKALFNNGFGSLGLKYFAKSQKIIPNDSEIYFHLAQYSVQVKSYYDARQMLRQSIDLNSTYTPAKALLEEVEKIIETL